MPELLRSAKLAVEKGLAQGRNESYVKQLSDYIIPALVEALHKVILSLLFHSYLLALMSLLEFVSPSRGQSIYLTLPSPNPIDHAGT